MTHAQKFFSVLALATVAIIPGASFAATKTPAPKPLTYAAKKLVATPPKNNADQLEVYRFTIGFKNTGTATWLQEGTNAVTVKTLDHVSVEHWFASSAWIDKTTVTAAATETVKPGEVGFFTLVLQAPTTAKSFQNPFALFVGNTKIANTDFAIPITVSKKTAPTSKQAVNVPTNTDGAKGGVTTVAATPLKTSQYLKATLMLRSTDTVSLMAGTTADVRFAFKNSGDRNWRNVAPSAITLQMDPSSNTVSFNDGKWVSDSVVETLSPSLVQAGELAFFTFTIKAPADAGSYNPQFRLVMNGDTLVTGSEFRLPVTVTTPPPPPVLASTGGSSGSVIVCAAIADVPATPTDPSTPTNDQTPNPNDAGSCKPPNVEPMMRIGIDTVQGQLGATSAAPFQVLDSNNNVVMDVPAGSTVFLAYDLNSQKYSAIGPGPILTSTTPYHVHATTEPSIITLSTYSNPTSFDATLNDNVFRGSVWVEWSEVQQKLWIVNQLGMEDYLRGLAESGNSAPIEYFKALIVAARTYALYEHDTHSKSARLPFDVYASVQDQAYRGYNIETRIPKASQAVDATHGQVVAYQGQVVITPYSASTDGHTRSWSEAWGGTDKPWLIDKPVPEDVGRRLYGHGVGMSQLAAEDMAGKEGKLYTDILPFFYVNTQITQWY